MKDEKIREAFLLIANEVGDEYFKDELNKILCEHELVVQVDGEYNKYCKCENCHEWILIEDYKEFLKDNWGILKMLDGSMFYKLNGEVIHELKKGD